MSKTAPSRIALASVLTLVLLAISVVPAAAGDTWRARGAEDTAFRLTN
jgi:hypothetical protein